MKKPLIFFLIIMIASQLQAQSDGPHFAKDSSSIATKKMDERYISFRHVVVPSTFVVYGFLRNAIQPIENLDVSNRNTILAHNPGFHSSVDNYLQWAPTTSLLLMDAAGMKMEHPFKQQMLLHLMSLGAMGGSVFIIKKLTNQYRPDSSAQNTFPSGHTATAFVGAEMVHQELKHTHPVLSYSGYVFATATGIYRMYNNKHWLSDVIAGAGFGILSTKASYWIFEKVNSKKRQKKNLSAVM